MGDAIEVCEWEMRLKFVSEPRWDLGNNNASNDHKNLNVMNSGWSLVKGTHSPVIAEEPDIVCGTY